MAEDDSDWEKYERFLKAIAIDPQLKQMDPLDLIAPLQLQGIITDEEYEKVESAGVKSQRKVTLFHSILMLKEPKGVVNCLRQIAKEHQIPSLIRILAEFWGEDGEPDKPDTELLNEAIEALKDAYIRKCEVMKEQWTKLFYEFPREFEMEKMFLDLEVMEDDIKSGEKTHSYEDIFGKDEKTRRKRRKIILEGDPGMGKTTFVHKIVQDWTNGDQFLNDQFEYVFLVRMNEVTSSDDIQSYLKGEILTQYPEYVDIILKSATKTKNPVLFVLDGFDEMDRSNERFVNFIKYGAFKGFFFKKPTIFITTRISNSTAVELLEKNDLTLRSHGFQNFEAVQKKYSEKIKNLGERETEQQKELYQNPLITGIAITIGEVPEELFDMMMKFFDKIIHRYWVIRKKEDPNSDWKDFKAETEKTLGKSAFVLLDHSTYFDKQIHKDLSKNIKLVSNDILTCQEIGLLWPLSKRHNKGQTNEKQLGFKFPHQLFLDFFAAMHVSSSGENLLALILETDFDRVKIISPFFYFLSGFLQPNLPLEHQFRCKMGSVVQICEVPSARNIHYSPWLYKADSVKIEKLQLDAFKSYWFDGNNSPSHRQFLHAMSSNSSTTTHLKRKDEIGFIKTQIEEEAQGLIASFNENIQIFLDNSCTIETNKLQSFIDFLNTNPGINKICLEGGQLNDNLINCTLSAKSIEFLNLISIKKPASSQTMARLRQSHIKKIVMSVLSDPQLIKQILTHLPQNTKFVTFDQCNIGDCEAEILSAWTPKISFISFQACDLSSAVVNALATALQNKQLPNLNRLRFESTPQVGECNCLVKHLPETIEVLIFNDCDLSQEFIGELSNKMKIMTSILWLDLSENAMVGIHDQLFASLPQTLGILILNCCCLSNQSITNLRSHMPSALIRLDISGTKFDGDGQPSLFKHSVYVHYGQHHNLNEICVDKPVDLSPMYVPRMRKGNSIFWVHRNHTDFRLDPHLFRDYINQDWEVVESEADDNNEITQEKEFLFHCLQYLSKMFTVSRLSTQFSNNMSCLCYLMKVLHMYYLVLTCVKYVSEHKNK